jgi:Na+-transporting NADH:ubiquinone oxidoreductase subunit NqrB
MTEGEEIMQTRPSSYGRQNLPEVEAFWTRVILYKLIYSICGLVIGLGCVISGIALLLYRMPSFADLGASGIDSKLINVVPGAALFFVGLFVIVVTSKVLKRVDVPREIVSEKFWKRLNSFMLIYSMFGLAMGAACIVWGVVVSVRAITGGVSGTVLIISNILGAALLFVGSLVILLTRYNVIARDELM